LSLIAFILFRAFGSETSRHLPLTCRQSRFSLTRDLIGVFLSCGQLGFGWAAPRKNFYPSAQCLAIACRLMGVFLLFSFLRLGYFTFCVLVALIARF